MGPAGRAAPPSAERVSVGSPPPPSWFCCQRHPVSPCGGPNPLWEDGQREAHTADICCQRIRDTGQGHTRTTGVGPCDSPAWPGVPLGPGPGWGPGTPQKQAHPRHRGREAWSGGAQGCQPGSLSPLSGGQSRARCWSPPSKETGPGSRPSPGSSVSGPGPALRPRSYHPQHGQRVAPGTKGARCYSEV